MQPPRRFFSVPSYKWGGYSLHDVQHTSADMSTQVSAISAGFFVLSNALWGVYFWRDSWHSLEYIFGFLFITTWLVPFSLFLSVAANESVLPGGANAGMTFSSSTNNLTGDKSSFLAKSVALSLCCVAHLDLLHRSALPSSGTLKHPLSYACSHELWRLIVIAQCRLGSTQEARQIKEHLAILLWAAETATG